MNEKIAEIKKMIQSSKLIDIEKIMQVDFKKGGKHGSMEWRMVCTKIQT